MKSKVITLENKAAGEIDLSDSIFGLEVRKDILARMVQYQLNKRRAGTGGPCPNQCTAQTVVDGLGRINQYITLVRRMLNTPL